MLKRAIVRTFATPNGDFDESPRAIGVTHARMNPTLASVVDMREMCGVQSRQTKLTVTTQCAARVMPMGASPSERRTRQALMAIARTQRRRRRAIAFGLVAFIAFELKTFYPGDQTVRNASESFARLMFSRSGFSFGTMYAKQFKHQVKIDASDSAIAVTKKEFTVQGKIPDKPEWTHDETLDALIAEDAGKKCFFYVEFDEPVLVLYDNGDELRHNLETGGLSVDIGQMRCTYYNGVHKPSAGKSMEDSAWRLVEDPVTGGKIVIMSTATTLGMLSAYHRTLVNHQAYAAEHGYGSILSLVSKDTLKGRSGKFAKHIALGVQVKKGEYDMSCHVDLDAWFASWDPLSKYSKHWPKSKSLFFGDTGQVWLNSGLMCARSNAWSSSFFERVINAVYDEGVGRDQKPAKFGFKRDQPAVWHVLASEWVGSAAVPYLGEQCSMWSECNPDANPIECWHWCFWDALQRIPGWKGLHDVNKLPNVYLDSQHNHPQMHRMCLRSCHSVLNRGKMSLCSAITGMQMCFPKDVDKMSLCDGKGCLKQLTSSGGAWLKHTGHQHWRDILPTCIPRSAAEARKEKRSNFALCEKSY